MLYESLDDIPRDCEVPFENLDYEEQGCAFPEISLNETDYLISESSIKDLLDWD